MARKSQIHYKGVRERWVKCVLDIVNTGKESSVAEVGKIIGVHLVQMNRLVRTVKSSLDSTEAPTIDMIIELATRYGYSCEWIMTGLGEMKLRETEKQKLKRLETQMNKIQKILNP